MALQTQCHRDSTSNHLRSDLGVILTHGSTEYQVGKLVAQAETYRLYLCEDGESNQFLLQVAAKAEHNARLERAAFILSELKQTSDFLEAEYAKTSDRRPLYYHRLFPMLVDGFVFEAQGRRRVNILAFKDVGTITEMVPLSNLREKDGLRIDLETSAWIMGRLLKLLALSHGQKIAVTLLSGNNILINPKRHFAVVFDWSSASIHPQEIPFESRKNDIATAAQAVFAAIGGDPRTQEYAYTTAENLRYIQFLGRLANRGEGNAERAHTNFYTLVYNLFGRGFKPFNTLPL